MKTRIVRTELNNGHTTYSAQKWISPLEFFLDGGDHAFLLIIFIFISIPVYIGMMWYPIGEYDTEQEAKEAIDLYIESINTNKHIENGKKLKSKTIIKYP